MKKVKKLFLVVMLGISGTPSMAVAVDDIGAGKGDPFDAHPPGYSDEAVAESFWQELFDAFMPKEDEVKQDERSSSN